MIEPPPSVAHLVDGLVNDLEPAAERVDARVREFRDAFERVVQRPALLAGSGSSYWAVAADGGEAAGLAARVRDELDVQAFAGPVLRSGPRE